MAEDKPQVSSELSRELNLFHITMMSLGMMIGAGVFLGIGTSMFFAGPGGTLLTFALNGCLALFTAMAYAELASAIPRAGGAYNFVRVGFGRGPSFLAGWIGWFASAVAGSTYALAFSIYSLRYLEQLGLFTLGPWGIFIAEKVVAVLVACFFIYTNYRGASETGKIGAFFTLGQTSFLVFIGFVGIWVIIRDPSRLQNFQPFLPYGWSKVLVTMGFTYLAFEGFEVIAQAGDETIDPQRNLPKGILYSVYIVTITYVLVVIATIVAVKAGSPDLKGMAPWEWVAQFKERGFGEAVGRLMPAGNFLLTLAVIFSATSALNATVYSATRVSYALGRDRMLPAFFSAISEKRKTPWVALLFTGGIIVLFAAFLPTMHVAASASIMFLYLFFMVNLSVIKIRLNMGDELNYGFLMPLFPVIPIVTIICQGVLAAWLVNVSWIAWVVALVWVGGGIAVYYFYSRHHAVTTEDEILVFEEQKAPDAEKKGYRVMISLANPKNAIELVRNAHRLCEVKEASVELLHMVPVPEQVPLHDAEKYISEGRESLIEAALYLEPSFPVSTTLRYCRSVARGIISMVREKKADMLVMGWHGRVRARAFTLGSTVDPIIERAPCSVVMMKKCGNKKFKKVLVPVSGGPNSPFALEVASMLADREEGEVVLFTVDTGTRTLDLKEFVEANAKRLAIPRDRVKTKTIKRRKVLQAILKEASGRYNLVVLGATQEPLLRRAMGLALPELIARECKKPFIMVKEAGGIHSWIRRWV